MAPAVGLILKLASEAGGSRERAVRTVRSSVRGRTEPSNGTLDAVRLAVAQHPDVAAAMLADIDADCRAAKVAAPMEVRFRIVARTFGPSQRFECRLRKILP